MKTVYAVSAGSYSDYRVLDLFAEKSDAEAFRDRVNRLDRYAEADVEEFRLHGKGEAPALYGWARTEVGVHSGSVEYQNHNTSTHTQAEKGKAEVEVSRNFSHVSILTCGDVDRVAQLHADTVAKIRAEIIGL